jgi:hypothetical protein
MVILAKSSGFSEIKAVGFWEFLENLRIRGKVTAS